MFSIRRIILLVAALLLALTAPGLAADPSRHHGHPLRDHRHWSSAIVIGAPLYYRPWYGYGFYPHLYSLPERVWIQERGAPAQTLSGPPPQQFWYRCDSANTFYPWVTQCPEPWRPVPVTPPAQP